jgi:hypothetical protein
MVAEIPRNADSTWRIYSWMRYGRKAFEAVLEKNGDTVLESGIVNSEKDARNFILAQQFARVNIDHLHPRRGAAFQRSLMQATSPYARRHANSEGAMVRGSQVVPDEDDAALQPLTSAVDGISTTGAVSIGAAIVGAAVLFTMFRR